MNNPKNPNKPCLIMMDFDGTLVPIAQTPQSIIVPKELIPLLKALQKAGHEVAIISGRQVKNIKEHLGITSVRIIGLHGLENDQTKQIARNPLLKEALEKFKTLQKKFTQLLIEDKGTIISVHTRSVAKHQQKAASLATLIVCNAMAEKSKMTPFELDFILGNQVVELRPENAKKSHAISELTNQHPQLFPIYIGDDTTDEEAFSALADKGFSIKVGSPNKPTDAKYRLQNVEKVYDYLKDLAKI